MQKNELKCYPTHLYRGDSNYGRGHYKHMFIEDVVTGIIPIHLNSDDDKSKASLECNDCDLDLIKNILNSFTQYGEKYNIDRLIKDAIEGIARDIAWYGESIYEICKISENEIKFISLIPTNFIDLKLFYIQTPPKNTEKRLFPKFINSKNLWKISIPKSLQKNYSYKKVLSSIDLFDSTMPKPMRDDLYQGNSLSTYDSKKYREKQFIHVNELTRDWGWDQRKVFANSETTPFFNQYKLLKFKQSQTIFREHIVSELNSLFSKLRIDAEVKIEGLLTSKELEEYIKKYLNDEIPYDDIFKLLYN